MRRLIPRVLALMLITFLIAQVAGAHVARGHSSELIDAFGKPSWLNPGTYVEYAIEVRKLIYANGSSVKLLSGDLTARYRWECEDVREGREARIELWIFVGGEGRFEVRTQGKRVVVPRLKVEHHLTILVDLASNAATLPNGTVIGPWLGWAPTKMRPGGMLRVSLPDEISYLYDDLILRLRVLEGTVKSTLVALTPQGSQDCFEVEWLIPLFLPSNASSPAYRMPLSVIYDSSTGLALNPTALFFMLLFLGIDVASWGFTCARDLATNVSLGMVSLRAPMVHFASRVLIAIAVVLIVIYVQRVRRKRSRGGLSPSA